MVLIGALALASLDTSAQAPAAAWAQFRGTPALLGTTHQWTGSESSDVNEMVQAFESAIAATA
jgi:hypothetical protein